jgi:hypothetical protein
MNRPTRLVPLALAVLLAGCFGVPPGTVRAGDTVTVSYVATDASGAVVAQGATATFVAGHPAAGLGPDLGNAVVGRHANETVSLTTRLADAVEAAQLFDERARVQTYNTSAFAKAVGTPTVGMNFSAYGYNATLTAVTPELVTFELLARDGLRQPFPEYGLTMVYSSQGDQLVKTLEPTPGKVFAIDFAGQIALQAIHPDGTGEPLPAGTYRVLPASGGRLHFAHTAGPDAALLDQDVTVALTIVTVEGGQGGAPQVTGGYGARYSPQLRGDPRSILGTPTAAP